MEWNSLSRYTSHILRKLADSTLPTFDDIKFKDLFEGACVGLKVSIRYHHGDHQKSTLRPKTSIIIHSNGLLKHCMPCTCTYSEKDYLNFICCDAPIVCEKWSNDEGVPGQNILLYNTGVGLQPRREGGGGGGG